MARLEDIRGLAESHASSISSSPRDWMNYLDTAARLYRYPFMDQFLIHAQRPQATACASLELWNQKMFRWVNRGAKGIALIDETTQKTRLRYVFDVQDTHMVNGGRTPYLWKLQEEWKGFRKNSRKRYCFIWKRFMDWKRKIRKIFQML